MKILLFGASGMIGQGVLRECLLAPDVELPLLKAVGAITTTERMGLAMLNAARRGAPNKIVGTKDINALARA